MEQLQSSLQASDVKITTEEQQKLENIWDSATQNGRDLLPWYSPETDQTLQFIYYASSTSQICEVFFTCPFIPAAELHRQSRSASDGGRQPRKPLRLSKSPAARPVKASINRTNEIKYIFMEFPLSQISETLEMHKSVLLTCRVSGNKQQHHFSHKNCDLSLLREPSTLSPMHLHELRFDRAP